MTRSTLATAAALFAGIEAGRSADIADLYADDLAVWHNFSDRIQNKADNLKTLQGLIASAKVIRYEVVERVLLADDRVVQRHILHVRTHTDADVVIPACIFISVRNGLITRIDEYLDTAQAAALRRTN